MRCTTCGCTVRVTRRNDTVRLSSGRRSKFYGANIHVCDHGQEEHSDHPASPRVATMSRRTYAAEMRREADAREKEWDNMWAMHESGVDER